VIRGVLVLLALAALIAGEAAAQKHVADPLEHFLGTAPPGRAKHALDDGVARASGAFNNDGLADVALWQEPDFGPHDGPVFRYLGRRTDLRRLRPDRRQRAAPFNRSRAPRVGAALVCEADAKVPATR
jgi:hypothetical protein